MNESVKILLHTYSVRFQFQHRPDFNIFRFIELAGRLGFQGVAISANNRDYRHLESKAPAQFARIKALLLEHGLICDLDTSGTTPVHLRTMLDVAAQIGARNLRTYTRYRFPEAIPRTIGDLAAIGDDAKRTGVRVLLENHETFRGADIAHILNTVNHPFVQALFDFGNSQMALEAPRQALAAMLPYSRAAHIKDHAIVTLPHQGIRVLGVPLGSGFLPIREMCWQLYQAGLREFIFEDSRGYHAPLKTERISDQALAQLGHGSFSYLAPPLDNQHLWFDPSQLDPTYLVEAEMKTLHRSWQWLRNCLADLDIPVGS